MTSSSDCPESRTEDSNQGKQELGGEAPRKLPKRDTIFVAWEHKKCAFKSCPMFLLGYLKLKILWPGLLYANYGFPSFLSMVYFTKVTFDILSLSKAYGKNSSALKLQKLKGR